VATRSRNVRADSSRGWPTIILEVTNPANAGQAVAYCRQQTAAERQCRSVRHAPRRCSTKFLGWHTRTCPAPSLRRSAVGSNRGSATSLTCFSKLPRRFVRPTSEAVFAHRQRSGNGRLRRRFRWAHSQKIVLSAPRASCALPPRRHPERLRIWRTGRMPIAPFRVPLI